MFYNCFLSEEIKKKKPTHANGATNTSEQAFSDTYKQIQCRKRLEFDTQQICYATLLLHIKSIFVKYFQAFLLIFSKIL